MYVGGEPCTGDKAILKKARDVLVAAKPNWLSMDYTTVDTMRQGDFKAGADWNGAALRAPPQEPPSVHFGFPKEGFPIWMDNAAILKDAQNVENAKLFLNFIMDPENAAMLSAFARYANGIEGSEKFMPADMQGAPELTLPEGNKGRFVLACPPRGQRAGDPDLDRDPEVTADLIVANARVLTMDPAQPRATAVAVRGNRIVARRRRRRGRGVARPPPASSMPPAPPCCPGFIESHLHVFPGGASLTSLQLDGVHGMERLAAVVRAWAAAHPDDRLIYGVQASYQILDEPLTRHLLDQVLPDRPSGIHAFDGHTVWANTKALELAGLLHGKELLPGNEIVMGADGLATGELREPGAYSRSWPPALGRAGEAGHHHRPRPRSRRPRPPQRAAGPRHHRPRPRLVRRGTASPRSTTWTATPTSWSCCASWTMPASSPAASACRST